MNYEAQSKMTTVTVEQARAVHAFSPVAWTISETPDGWLVHCGESVLISSVSRKPRLFRSVDTAVRRLGIEVGIKEFKVEAHANAY